jgi:hypothetical protein
MSFVNVGLKHFLACTALIYEIRNPQADPVWAKRRSIYRKDCIKGSKIIAYNGQQQQVLTEGKK